MLQRPIVIRYGLVLLFSTMAIITHICISFPLRAQSIGGFVSTDPNIQNALMLYNDQKYEEAEKAFIRAYLLKSTNQRDRIISLQYLGYINIILNKREMAHQYFMKLLSLDPTQRLDSAWDPPKFVREFNVALQKFNAQRQVQIESLTPDEIPSNEPLRLQFRVKDGLQRMSKLKLWYRLENSPSYFSRELQATPNPQDIAPTAPISTPKQSSDHSATQPTTQPAPAANTTQTSTKKTSPASPVLDPIHNKEQHFEYLVPELLFSNQPRDQAYYFEFYVTAFDQENKVIAELGSAKKPMRIKRIQAKEIKPPTIVIPSTPVYKKWWFWTIVGVAVAGGTTAIILVSLPPQPPETGGVVITIVK